MDKKFTTSGIAANPVIAQGILFPDKTRNV